uniref:Uncharacterized protein n=1 Tax=Nothoprocta perdicaria TaxID=30464 RepID=A0A8C6ZY31_NOTPE
MSVQVAAPAVELKELSGPMEKAAGPCAELPARAAACPAPPEREAPAGGAARPPPGARLPPAAKVPQASAMKRSDPLHPQHRHRDGGDGGGAAPEPLVSPDGSVTEAPRTVKKVPARGGSPLIHLVGRTEHGPILQCFRVMSVA